MKHRVFLVEDHPIYRRGLALFVGESPDLEVCGEAVDVRGALEGITKKNPHLVVVDLQLKESSGFHLIEEIHSRWPELRVLVLTMYDEVRYAEQLLRSGALGFVMKDNGPRVVLEAMRSVLRGIPYASERLKQKALAFAAGRRNTSRLSVRELDVFRMAGEGKTVPEIAGILNRSPKTVQNHVLSIQRKLEVTSRQAFYQAARDWVFRMS